MRVALLLLLVPAAAFAAPRTFEELAGTSIDLINAGIGVGIILAIVIYFYGISSGILSLQSGGSEALRQRLVWGMIAIFVMVSVWGIVGLVRNTLFGGGAGSSIGSGGGDFEEGDCLDIGCLGG